MVHCIAEDFKRPHSERSAAILPPFTQGFPWTHLPRELEKLESVFGGKIGMCSKL